MGRVKVRDQYGADHWIEEPALAYAPWRDYEVVQREDGETPTGDTAPQPAGQSQGTAATSAPSDDSESPVAEPGATERPIKPRKPAAE